MEKVFDGKVAIVTGGSFGIGQATAVAFAKRGAKVVVADWIVDKDHATMGLIKSSGGEAMFVLCDVSSSSEVSNLVEQAVARFGRVDYAFNNASIEGVSASTHKSTEESWDKTIGINLKGVWLCMKNEIREMLKVNKGAIVNCASAAGLNGFAGLPAYVANKHGVVGLTKSAALEHSQMPCQWMEALPRDKS